MGAKIFDGVEYNVYIRKFYDINDELYTRNGCGWFLHSSFAIEKFLVERLRYVLCHVPCIERLPS